jgi:hypothetical protein
VAISENAIQRRTKGAALAVKAPAITNATVAAGANPTKAEYDALVGKFNSLLAAARSAGIVTP